MNPVESDVNIPCNGTAYGEVTTISFQDFAFEDIEPNTEEITTVPNQCVVPNQGGQYLNETSSEEIVKEKPYPCSYCNKRFRRKTHLVQHTRTHTGEKPYVCKFCGKKFAYSNVMTEHARIHTGEKPYACSLCTKRFYRLIGLKSHMRIHAGGKIYECKLCGEMFGRQYSIRLHVQNKHPTQEQDALPDQLLKDDYIVLMPNANGLLNNSENEVEVVQSVTNNENINENEQETPPKMNQSLDDLTEELRMLPHATDDISKNGNVYIIQNTFEESVLGPVSETSKIVAKKFQSGGFSLRICETCGKQVRNLKSHMSIHKEKTLPCTKCDKLFSTKWLRNQHMKTHTGGDDKGVKSQKQLQCSFCKRGFLQKMTLIEHLRTHTGEKPFACKYCDHRSATKKSMQCHTRTHTGERPYCCTICGLRFGHTNVLKEHVRLHTGERPYACKLCTKTFTRASGLRNHMPTHGGGRAFACNVCGHKSNRKSDLMKHMKRHSFRAKTNVCNVCNKGFYTPYLLKKHIHQVHDRVRIACSVCKRVFGNEKNLEAHIEKYEGSKPICCGHCGKSFHEAAHTRRHILSHTKAREILFPCRICNMDFINSISRDEHEEIFAEFIPFECEICDKKFHMETCAQRHANRHSQKEIDDARTTSIDIHDSEAKE